jgi:hypothetical protein
MLPPGVIKGGAALLIRFGESGARATTDLDTSRSSEFALDEWLDVFEERLAVGWGGFNGTLSLKKSKIPNDVPDDYVMRRFQIRLAYMSREWTTITLELMHDEVGSTAKPETRVGQRVLDLYALLGLPEPRPIPLLPVHHQIAQKLHACTGMGSNGTNERAHDLVDLQLLVKEEKPDLAQVKATAMRLFASRKRQQWPPIVVAHPKWNTIYAESTGTLDVLPTVDEAVVWANTLIADIEAATL